jgi:hypothetical protein
MDTFTMTHLKTERSTFLKVFSAKGALLALAIWASAGQALAFVYPEHRDIAALAVARLDAQRKAGLDELWHEARMAHEKRLCEQAADGTQGVAPVCIDWAALSAIAGDHSCSSQDLTAIVLESSWILAVADVAARLKIDLSKIDVLPPTEQVPGSKDPIRDLKRRMETEGARAHVSMHCAAPITGCNEPIRSMQRAPVPTMRIFCFPARTPA